MDAVQALQSTFDFHEDFLVVIQLLLQALLRLLGPGMMRVIIYIYIYIATGVGFGVGRLNDEIESTDC